MGRKAAYRVVSDLLAANTPWEIARSRCPVGDDALAISYGLWLNLNRQQARTAQTGSLAVLMALGGKVPVEVWEELTGSREEAEYLTYRAGAAKREARLMAKHGFH